MACGRGPATNLRHSKRGPSPVLGRSPLRHPSCGADVVAREILVQLMNQQAPTPPAAGVRVVHARPSSVPA
jgi:hypothetical protein